MTPQPYHRQPGEPNRWYQRFRYFMELGPSRSIARCYREITNAARARQGRPLLSTSASCPKAWHDRARQFDWVERAAAWDCEQKRLERQQVEHVRAMARNLAEEAIQVLQQTLRGELKNPDGSLTEGQNCTQRRLAAEKILDLAGIGALELDPPESDPDEDKEIIGLRIIDPYSPEGLEHDRLVREQVNARYREKANAGQQPAQGKQFWFSDDL
jgi:hypothetical protein